MVSIKSPEEAETWLKHWGVLGMHWGVKAHQANERERIRNQQHAEEQKKLARKFAKTDAAKQTSIRKDLKAKAAAQKAAEKEYYTKQKAKAMRARREESLRKALGKTGMKVDKDPKYMTDVEIKRLRNSGVMKTKLAEHNKMVRDDNRALAAILLTGAVVAGGYIVATQVAKNRKARAPLGLPDPNVIYGHPPKGPDIVPQVNSPLAAIHVIDLVWSASAGKFV
jgi:hypothetical protein